MWDKVFLFTVAMLLVNSLNAKGRKKMTIQDMRNLLTTAGFPSATIDMFIAQAAHETGNLNFNSELSKTHNNFTGIKWLYPVYQSKYGYKGAVAPDGGWYVHYNTPLDWAKDYHRIMAYRSTTNAIGAPIDAKDTTDFVNRLNANAYFQADATAYQKGVNNFYNQLKNMA